MDKVGRRRFNVPKRKSQAPGACVRWTDSEFAGDMNRRPPVQVSGAKFRSGCLNRRRLPLPPINGSVSAPRLGPGKPQTSPGSVLTGKSLSGVFIGQGRRVIGKSELGKKTQVGVEAGNKASVQSASDPPVRPKNSISGPESSPRGGAHDAGLPDPKPQRNFCSGDSAVETEWESSEDQDGLQTKEGGHDEYYNDQRISDWILKVNSCLFSKEEEELTEPARAQEHDVATIKIIYSGE